MLVCGLFLAQARDPSPKHPDWLWAHQTSYSVGTKGSFPGETGGNIVVCHKVDHSPPSRAEITCE